jgi:hypothetical protein
MMPFRAALMALLIHAIVVGTSSSLAFSAVPGKEKNVVIRPLIQQQKESEKPSLLFTRRESIGAIFCSASIILGGSSAAAFAADVDECQTDCMYKCTTAKRDNDDSKSRKKKRGKTTRKSIMETSCREQQCKDHQQCKVPPPERKGEPKLLQAQDIKGLYPRWQDSF